MTIFINYDAIWGNSFLEGDNNSPIPKNGRKYIASMASLKKEENHKKKDISHDTVMGILNRLIGDQRKLWQARIEKYEDKYYFYDLESKITYKKKERIVNNESIYLRNMKKNNFDRNSWSGTINSNHPLITSSFSKQLFSVLYYSIDEIIDLILNKKIVLKDISLNPLDIKDQCEKVIDKKKTLEKTDRLLSVISILEKEFPKNNYFIKRKNKEFKEINVTALYYSSLYFMLLLISKDISKATTKNGVISGISKRSFTGKDFMKLFTSGKKIIYGNPYIVNYWIEENEKKTKITEQLKTSSGTLEIDIDINIDKAKELKNLIENAGVSTFYLGKKGLAYIDKIKI